MRSPLLLLALLTLCAPALAEPSLKLRQDGSGEVGPGQWFDLLLLVEPKEPVAEDALLALPAPLKGAEFAEAIYPAPDTKGAFTKPFTIRIPAKLAGTKAFELSVALRGKTAAGAAFEARATGKVSPFDKLMRHVSATVALKAPAVAGRANAVVVNATVIDGYHVYGTDEKYGVPIVGTLLPAPGARGGPAWTGSGPASPKGHALEGSFVLEIPFTPLGAGKVEARVLLDWSACDANHCDPNEMDYLPFSFEVAGASGAVGASTPSSGDLAASGGSPGTGAENLWQLIGLAVLGGVVALLMPCTYPLIPITISFFTKQAEARNKSTVPLALAYGAGIVAIFTLIGVAVSSAFVAGEDILNVAAGWQLNLVFALVFLAFGLSLLGLFDIRLPSFFDDLAAKASGTGGYMSVFVMGLTLVITSFTCTVPFMGGLLVLAAKDGEAGRAILAMAVFGLTMAIPFVILSLSPKGFQALPKSGEWMKRLKVTLGIIELGLVLKFVSNVDIATNTFAIGRTPFLVLWAVSFLAAGLYLLGIFDLFARGVRWSLGGGRAVAGLVMLAITAALAYAATGPRLGAVLGTGAGDALESFLPSFERDYGRSFVAVTEDFAKGIEIATEKSAPVFLHFTGYT
ncbi:MAG: protein-disulfide reductase DsbD family protein [Planctomycetota bacterium]